MERVVIPAPNAMEMVIARLMRARKCGCDSGVALLIARRAGKSWLNSILLKQVKERGEDNGGTQGTEI